MRKEKAMKPSGLIVLFAVIVTLNGTSLADEGKDESGKGRDQKEYRFEFCSSGQFENKSG